MANQTSERVKKRCIEIIYSWTKGLPSETKIVEAYEMLKRQGIVDKDPTNVDTVSVWLFVYCKSLKKKKKTYNFSLLLTYHHG